MYRTSTSAFHDLSQDGSLPDPRKSGEAINAIGRQFSTLAEQAGLPYFVVTRFPQGDQPEFAANFVMGNWPASLQALYEASDAFGFSRVVSRLKDTIVPFFTTDAIFLSDVGARNDEPSKPEFLAHGLTSHVAFSLHDTGLQHYVVVFSGATETISRDRIASLHLGSLELIDLATGRGRAADGMKERLSARELECLRWTAAGKSSEEIAIILTISSHTVVSYLKSAMRKLNSVNRMQAIARACRLRLL